MRRFDLMSFLIGCVVGVTGIQILINIFKSLLTLAQ